NMPAARPLQLHGPCAWLLATVHQSTGVTANQAKYQARPAMTRLHSIDKPVLCGSPEQDHAARPVHRLRPQGPEHFLSGSLPVATRWPPYNSASDQTAPEQLPGSHLSSSWLAPELRAIVALPAAAANAAADRRPADT